MMLCWIWEVEERGGHALHGVVELPGGVAVAVVGVQGDGHEDHVLDVRDKSRVQVAVPDPGWNCSRSAVRVS
jgi:hypothetical protein